MKISKLLITFLLITSLACTRKEVKCQKNYVLADTKDKYSYCIGRVFIGSQEELDKLEDVTEKDILVLDDRKAKDPDMKIYDSGKVQLVSDMDEILQILLDYEKDHPTGWKRTLESMRNEWLYHNLSFYLNYKTNRTKDVDLNNADEETYKHLTIK